MKKSLIALLLVSSFIGGSHTGASGNGGSVTSEGGGSFNNSGAIGGGVDRADPRPERVVTHTTH